MRAGRPIQIALALLAVGGGAFLLWRASGGLPSNPDAPGGTLWVCTGTACGREFTLSTKELAAFYDANPGGAPACPACGKSETLRAVRCGACGKAVESKGRSGPPASGAARACPHCGKPLR